jgi:hypothetical protein
MSAPLSDYFGCSRRGQAHRCAGTARRAPGNPKGGAQDVVSRSLSGTNCGEGRPRSSAGRCDPRAQSDSGASPQKNRRRENRRYNSYFLRMTPVDLITVSVLKQRVDRQRPKVQIQHLRQKKMIPGKLPGIITWADFHGVVLFVGRDPSRETHEHHGRTQGR